MDKRARVIEESKWVGRQLHGALKHATAVDHAVHVLMDAQLPLHPDKNKNWDHFLALWLAMVLGCKDDPVLDAGACEDSAFLPALAECGYTSLTGCNIDQTPDVVKKVPGGEIRYQFGDIHDLSYPTNTFRFVMCQSVIEHGVRVPDFLIEMARILRPGGILFISTDYWQQPIDTGGQKAFGAPVHIFNEEEIQETMRFVRDSGLFLAENPTLTTCERPVKWLGMEYTFLNLVLYRR